MRDLIYRQAAIERIDATHIFTEPWGEALLKKLPSVDAVPVEAYKQVRWERDIAMQQLYALGYGLGEKVVPVVRCKDCKHLQKWRSEESAKRFGQIYECARNVFDCPKPEDFCSHAERKE